MARRLQHPVRTALVLGLHGDRAIVLTDTGFFLRVRYQGAPPVPGRRYPLRAGAGAGRREREILAAGPLWAARGVAPTRMAARRRDGVARHRPRSHPRHPARRRRDGIPAWHRLGWQVAVAAGVILALLGWNLAAALAGTAAAVAVDFKPSVELRLDAAGRVRAVDAFNADGGRLAAAAGIPPASPLPAALDRLIAAARRLGYLRPGDPNAVLLAVTRFGPTFGPPSPLVPEAVAAVERALAARGLGGSVLAYQARPLLWLRARLAGLTVSRYLLARQGIVTLGGVQAADVARSLREHPQGAGLLDPRAVVGPVVQRQVAPVPATLGSLTGLPSPPGGAAEDRLAHGRPAPSGQRLQVDTGSPRPGRGAPAGRPVPGVVIEPATSLLRALGGLLADGWQAAAGATGPVGPREATGPRPPAAADGAAAPTPGGAAPRGGASGEAGPGSRSAGGRAPSPAPPAPEQGSAGAPDGQGNAAPREGGGLLDGLEGAQPLRGIEPVLGTVTEATRGALPQAGGLLP